MANENDVSFELDAGKLLATLHLAAAQAIPNSIAINTGIIDPQAKPNLFILSTHKFQRAFKKCPDYWDDTRWIYQTL